MRRFLCIIGLVIFSVGLMAQTADSLQIKAKEPLYYAADQSLFMMPTAYTMPKGTQSFTDYELFVLQFANAVGENTHISAIVAFPVTMEMLQSFTAGVKHNYIHNGKLQAAVWGSYTPYYHALTVGNVFSLGSPKASVHAAASWGTDFSDYSKEYVIMLGGMTDFTPKTAFLLEVLTSSQILEDYSNGLITFGVRFKGKQTSWDIGGFRPLDAGGLDFFALPFLKATFIF